MSPEVYAALVGAIVGAVVGFLGTFVLEVARRSWRNRRIGRGIVEALVSEISSLKDFHQKHEVNPDEPLITLPTTATYDAHLERVCEIFSSATVVSVVKFYQCVEHVHYRLKAGMDVLRRAEELRNGKKGSPGVAASSYGREWTEQYEEERRALFRASDEATAQLKRWKSCGW